jgi:hypothetical protein
VILPFPWLVSPARGDSLCVDITNSSDQHLDSLPCQSPDSPVVLLPSLLDLFEKLSNPLPRHRAHPDRPEPLIEFVQDQTHRVHQRVHVISLAVPALGGSLQRFLEELPVVHPVDCELMRLNVGLVEDENEGKTGFIQDPVERGVSL